MRIPIIFIHTGDPYYLDFSVNQAHLSNPENEVYLVTDVLTRKYDFVNYISIDSLLDKANGFEKYYQHMSTNSYKAELFCFQRWFILQEFCLQYNFQNFLYLDSDIMLYCKVDEVFKKFNQYSFTITNQQGPQCCYFSSLANLSGFCNFIIKLYTVPEYKQRFELKHQHHLKNDLPGGVCDMTAFIEYQKDHPGSAIDLSIIDHDTVFDDNFNVSDGFAMESMGKKIRLENGIPYGTLIADGRKIRFHNLHFQGPAKKYIYQFYTGHNLNKLKRKIGFDLFLLRNYNLYRVFRKLGYKVFDY